jgi:glycine betaine/proline transport system substrate-binding protein
MSDNQATGADGAMHFLKTQPEVWASWVPADVAEKIKAGL